MTTPMLKKKKKKKHKQGVSLRARARNICPQNMGGQIMAGRAPAAPQRCLPRPWGPTEPPSAVAQMAQTANALPPAQPAYGYVLSPSNFAVRVIWLFVRFAFSAPFFLSMSGS